MDVAPDIDFGPIEQRLHTNMLALYAGRRELAPKFGRLILVVPFELCVAWRKVSLFRPSRIFIPANTGDERVPFVIGERLLKRHGLQLMRHGHRIMRLVTNPAFARLGIDFDDQIEVVMLGRPLAELQHLGKFVGRVDVQHGKRNLSKKGFAREPDENIGILPHRPRHGDVFESVISLSKNKDALVLELIEMSAFDRRHDLDKSRSIHSRSSCRNWVVGCFVGRSTLFDLDALAFLLRPVWPTLVFVMPETHPTAYDSKIEGNVIFTRFDAALNWVRKNSLWPMPMGLACCAIELMATAASRFDIARFGAEVMRFSPRQCDVMIVAGTVTYKMALAVKRIYEQMPEPKWVIAMGACASTGGMYRSYAVLQGIDQLLPVDVYISGCPPRPEALLAGLMKLQEKISLERSLAKQKPELVERLEEALS